MREPLNSMHITVGFNRINATWIDGTAIWMSDYYPHHEPDIEALQLARRERNLTHAFMRYKLLDPTTEIIPSDTFDRELVSKYDSSKLGAQLLRVTTLLMPYVDPAHLRPLIGLGQQTPSEQQVNETLVFNGLRAGGQAIYDNFGSAMIEHQSSQRM